MNSDGTTQSFKTCGCVGSDAETNQIGKTNFSFEKGETRTLTLYYILSDEEVENDKLVICFKLKSSPFIGPLAIIYETGGKHEKLIKIEMERAFKNKMLIVSVAIGLIIVGFNIWNEIIPARKTLDRLLEMGKYSSIQLPGLYMKWMGVRPGSYAFLYYFIMPLLTALPYSISILMDVKKHYVNNIFTRIDKRSITKQSFLPSL